MYIHVHVLYIIRNNTGQCTSLVNIGVSALQSRGPQKTHFVTAPAIL